MKSLEEIIEILVDWADETDGAYVISLGTPDGELAEAKGNIHFTEMTKSNLRVLTQCSRLGHGNAGRNYRKRLYRQASISRILRLERSDTPTTEQRGHSGKTE